MVFRNNTEKIDQYGVVNRVGYNDDQELYNPRTQLKTDTRVSTVGKATRNL
jgi:hypothetical protein